jgi:hypothetical protein
MSDADEEEATAVPALEPEQICDFLLSRQGAVGARQGADVTATVACRVLSVPGV